MIIIMLWDMGFMKWDSKNGRNPKTSVLNGNNQIHSVPNVYVTDGAL